VCAKIVLTFFPFLYLILRIYLEKIYLPVLQSLGFSLMNRRAEATGPE